MAWTNGSGRKSGQGQLMDMARVISDRRSEFEHIQRAILSQERFGRPSIGTAEAAAQSRTELRTVRGAGAST
jgi:hypothetical protein